MKEIFQANASYWIVSSMKNLSLQKSIFLAFHQGKKTSELFPLFFEWKSYSSKKKNNRALWNVLIFSLKISKFFFLFLDLQISSLKRRNYFSNQSEDSWLHQKLFKNTVYFQENDFFPWNVYEFLLDSRCWKTFFPFIFHEPERN